MKKLLLLIALLLCFQPLLISGSVFAQDLPKYEICANSANVYQEASLTANVICTLKNKTKITLEFDTTSPKVYENEGFSFYKVIDTSSQGFVLCDFVGICDNTIESIPNFNAKTNCECTVYSKVGENFEKTQIVLAKNTRIFLYEGYKEKTNVAISFLYNNEVMYGYLPAEQINPDGINPIIITCIVLIIALISIIFALVFMKRKKIKLKKVGIKS
ncbi:MAG: hypothetical protein IJZ62_01505 [Clostridia bacterium]|nr:hypothetical protein [Clostridia bacterium]